MSTQSGESVFQGAEWCDLWLVFSQIRNLKTFIIVTYFEPVLEAVYSSWLSLEAWNEGRFMFWPSLVTCSSLSSSAVLHIKYGVKFMKFKYSVPSSKDLILYFLPLYIKEGVLLWCSSHWYTDSFHWRDQSILSSVFASSVFTASVIMNSTYLY